MKVQTRSKWMALQVAIAALTVLIMNACNAEDRLRVDMSEAEVIRIMGEPSRKAVLIGKALRSIDELPAGEDVARFRLVFVYEESGLQVWFRDGKVTGITRNGVSTMADE